MKRQCKSSITKNPSFRAAVQKQKFHRNVPAKVLFRISWGGGGGDENFENLLVRNHKT